MLCWLLTLKSTPTDAINIVNSLLYILYQSDLDLSLAKQVRMKKTLAFDCSARSVESSIYTIISESESDDSCNKSRDQVQVQTKRKINSSRRYREKEEFYHYKWL